MNNKYPITDPDEIERLGELRKDENYRFRAWLKSKDPKRIDSIVHNLNAVISAQIDCTSCGNCCKQLTPRITQKEQSQLAKRMGITSREFTETYTEKDDGKDYFKNKPCHFLADNKCTVYDDRPGSCREYPFLHKKDFTTRLYGVIENYSICPIVFNVFEGLKGKLNFR